jgi:hypothetical protein
VSFFESEIGLSHGYVNSITENIGNDKLERIVEHDPELNIEWLLLGKGEMLKTPLLLMNQRLFMTVAMNFKDCNKKLWLYKKN